MTEHILDLLREFLAHYGYAAIAIVLLLENTGIPLPGETILLMASALAYSEHRLSLPWIILTGIAAATIGDNFGFWIGYRGGRPLLLRYRVFFHISEDTIARGEELISRYGAATILFARFVAGLRIFAGPLAGVLRMNWRKFAIFNFLGALLWAAVICRVGYSFGRHWNRLQNALNRVDLLAFLAAILLIALFALRYQSRRRERNKAPESLDKD
jgi:membrane protein DedA with SNARE-associated domain